MVYRSLVIALIAQALVAIVAAVQASGQFNFLTYNVARLPAIINGNDIPGDKRETSRLIGAALARENHDIVHIQEDFAYHAEIYETDLHPWRTPTSGTVVFGDGLNTLTKFDYIEFTRTKWDRCSLHSGDCLTPKGFTFMRMPSIGFELHLYNLHADAGGNDDDIAARSAGIDQILKAIGHNSDGHPVIIAGDFNDRWTNAEPSIAKLLDAGFHDPWIDIINDGGFPIKDSPADACGNPALSNDCETVDKIFYRSGESVTLTATSFDYVPEDFVQPDGNILSDHNPVLVTFNWTPA